MTVWKYTIDLTTDNGAAEFEIPQDSPIVLIGPEPAHPECTNLVCIWVLVDPEAPKFKHKFRVCGTGRPIDPMWEYVGSVVISPYAWHVFESVI